jgi:hypothetical protein
MMNLLAFVFLAAALAVPAAAATHTDRVIAVEAAQAPSLDPSLADPQWATALKADSFTDFSIKAPAPLPTTAYLLYDDRNLYVAFHCVQAGVPIIVNQKVDNAGLDSDDHVSILIDTAGTGARTYEFLAAPTGVHDQRSSENSRYAPPWRASAKIFPNGDYNVVMAIPLRDIRMQAGRVQSWRINFSRYVAARSDSYTWAFEPTLTSITDATKWPWLDGLKLAGGGERPKPRADVYALASAGSQHNVFQNGIGNFGPMKPRPLGVDFTYPFTGTLAFVATVNPDFSNVEQDQATIAPQEFQRFYNEYRPFFAQGAGYFNTLPAFGIGGPGNVLLYTPSIGIFDRGLKIEGTSGRNAIGVLNVVGPDVNDSAFGYTYGVPDSSLTLSANGVVARHDAVHDTSMGIGMLANNVHSGVYTMFRAEREAGTLVTDASAGGSYYIGEGISNQKFDAAATFLDVDPQFSPLDGFTQITDVRGLASHFTYHGTGARQGLVKRYSIQMWADRLLDRSGAAREADTGAMLDMDLKNQLTLHAFGGPSELRSYDAPYPAYTNGQNVWYNRRSIGLGYREDTSEPAEVTYFWGPFNGYWIQQLEASAARQFGLYGVSLEFDGNVEHTGANGPVADSQWLRRFSLTRSFGRDAALAIGIRSINGNGGFAVPGTNLAFSFQKRFENQNELYLVYGTPAADATLHRFLVKFVFHAGADTGT